MADEQLVEFGGKVPASMMAEFLGNFPQHGSISWFVRGALSEFNRKCAENPALRELMSDSLNKFIYEASVRK